MTGTCKVITQANQVKHSLSDLVAAMRKLRAARRLCERCPEQDCLFIRQLSAEIKSALQELSVMSEQAYSLISGRSWSAPGPRAATKPS